MTDIHRRDTGSALQDRLLAERDRIRAAWREPRIATSPPNKQKLPAWLTVRLPSIPKQHEKPLSGRLAEARKLRGTVSEAKFHMIINAIYGSARDRGEYVVVDGSKNIPEEIACEGVPAIADIQTVVAESFGLTREEMLSVRRCHRLILPRQIAMYLSTLLIPRSLEYIGTRFGYDHSDVSHAVRKIKKLILMDPAFAAEIEALKDTVLG